MQKVANSVSIEHIQQELGINQGAIVALDKAGLLELVCSDFGTRITDASLQRFPARYASCRQVSKPKSMAQKELVALCKELQTEVLSCHGDAQSAEDSFIERHHAMLLGIYNGPSFGVLGAA